MMLCYISFIPFSVKACAGNEKLLTGSKLAEVAIVIRTTDTSVIECAFWPTGGVVSARMNGAVINSSFTVNA